ncbi:leukemia NUP98 fusion partner 1 [Salvelinus alpinus]
MALRLLPAFSNEDEDDDGNFTNWMSSYWGHGAREGGNRTSERKRSFRRPARSQTDRRASLPCMSQLNVMQLSCLHAAAADTMAPTPVHMKPLEEKGSEVRNHPRARRASSDGNNRVKSALPEKRITTIPELAESFNRRLRLHNKKVMSPREADSHEDMCNGGGGVQELQCSHRFHKEVASRPDAGRPRSGTTAGVCDRRKSVTGGEERRSSGEGSFSKVQEDYCIPRRQLSLRRQR